MWPLCWLIWFMGHEHIRMWPLCWLIWFMGHDTYVCDLFADHLVHAPERKNVGQEVNGNTWLKNTLARYVKRVTAYCRKLYTHLTYNILNLPYWWKCSTRHGYNLHHQPCICFSPPAVCMIFPPAKTMFFAPFCPTPRESFSLSGERGGRRLSLEWKLFFPLFLYEPCVA